MKFELIGTFVGETLDRSDSLRLAADLLGNLEALDFNTLCPQGVVLYGVRNRNACDHAQSRY